MGSTNLGFPKPERTTTDAKKLYPLTGLMYRSYAQKSRLMENLQFWVCEFNTVQGLRMNYPGLFELVAKFCQWINLHLLEIKQHTLFDDSQKATSMTIFQITSYKEQPTFVNLQRRMDLPSFETPTFDIVQHLYNKYLQTTANKFSAAMSHFFSTLFSRFFLTKFEMSLGF